MQLIGSKVFNDDSWDERVTVLGPCPGCDSWQLDYTNAVVREFSIVMSKADPSSGLWTLEPDLSPFYAAIEHILQEHLAECPHLHDLVQAAD